LALPLLVLSILLATLLAYVWWMRSRDSVSFKLSGSMRCTAIGHLFIQFHGCIEETGRAEERLIYVCFVS
jgi:hypothetical protein